MRGLIKITSRHGIVNRKRIEKIYKTKSWSFEMINKIYKPLPRLIKKKGEKS